MTMKNKKNLNALYDIIFIDLSEKYIKIIL